MRCSSLKSAGLLASICVGLVTFSVAAQTSDISEPAVQRPNIVFILADDLGFSDIAPYGSEVTTPTLSALAEQGVRFTNYHTAANCAPARAMLLTGINNHLAGVPNIPEMLAPEQRVHENYQGVLGNNVVTVATLLEDAGYHTYMAGKWHLGDAPDKRPSRRGFERTVALMDSGADNWEQKSYLPIYETANWFADGERFELPEEFYSSRFLIDKTIEFIDSNIKDGRPFFAYVPFQAVHMPVQAPKEYVDRYLDVYTNGWDVLREQRLQQAVELGLVPAETKLVRMASTGDWESLSAERKRYEAKRMAVYAGMIEAMDFNIGRLIDYLKASGAYENTIFIFTSDNGAEASGPDDPHTFMNRRFTAGMGYHLDYDSLGQQGSYNTISPSFASAAASPLSYYKFYTGEGGLRVPLIISGDPLVQKQPLSSAFAWATDITPTILSMAGVQPPGPRYAGKPVLPITGRNLLPLLNGDVDRVYGPDDAIGYELTGHAALFQGDFKLVRNMPPQGDGEWHLYNIVVDPGEVVDLSGEESERLQEMLAAYAQFETQNGVQPLPLGYSQTGQIVSSFMAQRMQTGIVVFLLTLLVLLPFYVAYRRAGPRGRLNRKT